MDYHRSDVEFELASPLHLPVWLVQVHSVESQGQVRVFLLAERESHLPIDLDFMAVGSYSELAKDVFINLLFETESGPFQQLVFSSFEENLRWGKRYFKAEFGLVIILVDVVEGEEIEKFM